jgi:hypothetical protein
VLARLIGLLGAESKETRRFAAEDLIALVAATDTADATIAALREAIVDADPRRRWSAAFVLYRAGSSEDDVFGAALEALGADDGDVRWAAAEIAVALTASASERRRRIRGLAATRGAAGRKMALYCLRDLRDGDDAVLVDALAADDAGVRMAAVACYGRLPVLSEMAVDAILAAVERDPDAGLRRAAAVALRRATNHEARVRPVLERLRSQASDPDLARAAERALAGLAAARDAK